MWLQEAEKAGYQAVETVAPVETTAMDVDEASAVQVKAEGGKKRKAEEEVETADTNKKAKIGRWDERIYAYGTHSSL